MAIILREPGRASRVGGLHIKYVDLPHVAAPIGLVPRGRDEGRELAARHSEAADREWLGDRHHQLIFADRRKEKWVICGLRFARC
jgi:hypothetical protein